MEILKKYIVSQMKELFLLVLLFFVTLVSFSQSGFNNFSVVQGKVVKAGVWNYKPTVVSFDGILTDTDTIMVSIGQSGEERLLYKVWSVLGVYESDDDFHFDSANYNDGKFTLNLKVGYHDGYILRVYRKDSLSELIGTYTL